VGCRFVGNLRGEVREVGAKLLIFLADLRELGGDGVQLGGDSYYARDGGTEDREDGAFASSYGLEYVRGEVVNQVGVWLKAVPGLGENFRQKSQRV